MVSTLCLEMRITRKTRYQHISPDGQLQAVSIKLQKQGTKNKINNIGTKSAEVTTEPKFYIKNTKGL